MATILIVSLSFLLPAQQTQLDIYKRPRQFERSRDYDAKHYRVELTFDLDEKIFWGTNTITLTPLKNEYYTCVLDAEELIVDAVKNPAGAQLEFEQTERHIIVHFPDAYNFGEDVLFTVEYHAKDPQRGLYFDDKTDEHPQMVTTVSWPEYAHHWLPCYDYPHDKVTHEFIITVKDTLKVLGNGRLVRIIEDKLNGTNTYHWSQDLPHSTYLFLLAIGPFAVIEDSLGPLPVNYWVYEEGVEDAKWIFEKTPYMIEFFDNIYGYKYPWAKYDQVISPRFGGGAENTSATLLGQGVIHDRKAEKDYSWERTIAHEIAHQWWGDLITLRSWEHTWLNESFGTYSDYLYTRYDKGKDEGAYELLRKKNSYLREAHTRYMRPIVFDRYERAQQNFDSHTYPKGAVVLHMLRFILGDEPFFRTLKHFLHKHEFEAVATHDFMKAVKEATGENMDWFFEQYIFSPGHPVFDVSYVWNEGAGNVRMMVRQVQDTSKGIPIYKVPVIIGIHTDEGKALEKVWIEKQEEVFTFPVEEKPLMMRFDEGNYLLKEWTFDKSANELLYQLKNDDVIGRSWAASELIKHKDDTDVVDALIACARNDEFWAVRQSAVETLGEMKREEDIELFKEKCSDKKSRVRAAALGILGELGKAELVPFLKERFEAEDSYLVQAEALRSIGKCGDPSHIPYLEEAAQMKSYRDVIKRAAESAIKTIQGRSSSYSPIPVVF
ncbi:MAG: M1 family metallopeptidase [Candidatus Aminicenantes bacterium]|nr:MAG: M1 family metallopeptidase [Candidatus Aminicenantes bacterium]